MSKQKDKFELFQRLQSLGFTYEEAVALRRIEMTLQRWGELECGTGEGQTTRSIERDGENGDGKPFMRIQYPTANGYHDSRYSIADREAGALNRLRAIVARRNHGKRDKVVAYHQGDCRGCNLYLILASQLKGHNGEALPLDQYYTRGLAVCA